MVREGNGSRKTELPSGMLQLVAQLDLNPKESQMNRAFNPISTSIRLIFASAAVMATLLVDGSINGLVDHYNADAQIAAAHHLVASSN